MEIDGTKRDLENARDPAIDPRPGDLVRSTVSKNVKERIVKERKGNDIWYRAFTGNAPARERLCWITTWQDWCRANKVSAHPASGATS